MTRTKEQLLQRAAAEAVQLAGDRLRELVEDAWTCGAIEARERYDGRLDKIRKRAEEHGCMEGSLKAELLWAVEVLEGRC